MITLKHSFDGTDGDSPFATLTAAGGGIFYGTSAFGGNSSLGNVFAFDSTAGTVTSVASCDGTNCDDLRSELVAAGGGLFYGTSRFGGLSGDGAVFQFDSNAGTLTLLDSFGPAFGGPVAGLTAAGGGQYYGTTPFGGLSSDGALYSFSASNPNPVPGPLPLLGAGAAFGWSRRLRQRVRQAPQMQPLFPAQSDATGSLV